MIFISAGCEPEVNRRLGRAWGVMDSLDRGVLRCRYLCGRWRLNSFGTRSLWRILGYRWSDFVSNERLLRETRMRFVTCIVRERQLRLCGHVAHFPDADPAHQILSVREPREWRRPMGRPRASWLQQVDRHLKEMGMGLASALGMARRRPLEYRWKVDAATRCSGTCSHT